MTYLFIMDDDPDLEPVRSFELKLLEGEMKVFVSNVEAALSGLRADFADLKADLAKRDEERARQQNAREWRLFGAMIGALGLAVVILGMLIRLP